MIVSIESLELSSINIQNNNLLVVNDDSNERFIYRVDQQGDSFSLSKVLEYEKLAGASDYFNGQVIGQKGAKRKRSADFEGIAVCDDGYWVINERELEVFKVTESKLEHLELKGIESLRANLKPNRGFEGVAADCENKVLYLAKEAEQATLISVDMKTGSLISVLPVPESPKIKRVYSVKNEKTGAIESITLPTRYSDLYYRQGYVYVLEKQMNKEVIKYEVSKESFVDQARIYDGMGEHHTAGAE